MKHLAPPVLKVEHYRQKSDEVINIIYDIHITASHLSYALRIVSVLMASILYIREILWNRIIYPQIYPIQMSNYSEPPLSSLLIH